MSGLILVLATYESDVIISVFFSVGNFNLTCSGSKLFANLFALSSSLKLLFSAQGKNFNFLLKFCEAK